MTIYVFQKHYDYDEIGTMLEHREIPPESRGHWHYDVVDAYAAIVPPKNSEYALDALLGPADRRRLRRQPGKCAALVCRRSRAVPSPPRSTPRIRACGSGRIG